MAEVRLPFGGVSASGSVAGALTFRTVGGKTFVANLAGRPGVPITNFSEDQRVRVLGTRRMWRWQSFNQAGGMFSIRDVTNYSCAELFTMAQESGEFVAPNRLPRWAAAMYPSGVPLPVRFQQIFQQVVGDERGSAAYTRLLLQGGVMSEPIPISGTSAEWPVDFTYMGQLWAYPVVMPELIADLADDQEPDEFVEWWVLYLPPGDFVPSLRGREASAHFERVKGYSVAHAKDLIKEARKLPDGNTA